MGKIALFATVAGLAGLAACAPLHATSPRRFAFDPKVAPHQHPCGSHVESANDAGFVLEVRREKGGYDADGAIQSARQCFTKEAEKFAREHGRSIEPLTSADMNATVAQDPTTMMGRVSYTVYVSGRVHYAE